MKSTRRTFIQTAGAVVGAAIANSDLDAGGRAAGFPLTAPQDQKPFAASPLPEVRIGYVGVGGMGSNHVRNLLRIPGARIAAVCDIVEERTKLAQEWTVKAGQPEPKAYTRGPRDFERMCETEELDLVYTATPWEWHVPVCVAAMKNGKHAATEVPAAMTLDDCWQLVEHAEKHRKHCVMMENCNYDRMELMVYNMTRKGMFGEILHGEGGYLHDLRPIKFSARGEGLWRRAWAMKHNANLYPTHGLGPVANCMNINRGDRFDYLVSMSSPSRGLQEYAKEHFPEGSPQRAEHYVLGDVNVSLIKTAMGRSIYVSHDTNLPRPYSRIHLVQGTKGLFQGYPDRVYVEGRSKEHQWDVAKTYLEEFDHPLWSDLNKKAEGAGHGGMDFIEDYRLIKCLREGLPTDMTVYDAAALSAVVHLTERSNAKRSAPMDVPDFTKGRWKTTPPWEIVRA
jgi:Oxidoreductase family, NAD-binding Rossmann fold